jgi:DNA-binding beta-propeller fold protein YncE
MSNKTIAKFIGLVILLVVATAFGISCSHASSNDRYAVNSSELSPDWTKPAIVGRIESKAVKESSGLAASPCQPNVFWTHNDSGDDAFVYAMDGTGKDLGEYEVMGASNDDWEDMAAYKDADGTCYLYVGDVGNNKLEKSDLRVYRVKEPTISGSGPNSEKKDQLRTEPAQTALFKYQDTPHNAETMMVNPKTGEVYVMTKRVDGPSLVFKFKPNFGSNQPVIAQRVGEVALPAVPNGLLTGGAISPDAKRVIVCDYSSGYELTNSSSNFDDIWKSKPVPVDLGERKHGEAITFGTDGRSIYGTNEGKKAEIFELKLK